MIYSLHQQEVRGIKNISKEIRDAVLFEREKTGVLSGPEIEAYTRKAVRHKGYSCQLPKQVHEILVAHGEMANPIVTHCGEEALKVSKSDWIYRMEFEVPSGADRYIVRCNGLDTIVDVYMNGTKIGSHRDMFYPFETEICPESDEANILLFHFYSPVLYLQKMKEMHQDECYISPAHYIRKAPHDFEDFLGIKPCFAAVGIFEDVLIESQVKGWIEEFSVAYSLDEQLNSAVVSFQVRGCIAVKDNYYVGVIVEDGSGSALFRREVKLGTADAFDLQIQTEQLLVDLWWPSGYGEQPLYCCRVYLVDKEVISSAEKQIGFRQVEFRNPFDLYVNGICVKLWGANLVPINGLTHCFDSERAKKILRLAKNANMNILRLWGGGEPYPDELYRMADEMGLLIWGEFFHKWGMYPEAEEYMEEYRKEAIYMLKSFRHHPALIMWCGGNESQMGAEMDFPGQPYTGTKIFQEYEQLCKELDSEKYFHLNSPMDGTFVNDPRAGDFHGWNHLWYVPYDRYPVMFSENSRVSPPVLKSLKKYIPNKEELWPPGFISRRTCFEENLLPPAWMKLKAGPEPYWCSPVEQFYDASTPEDLIYQCQAAHGKLMKTIGERIRRGRPAGQLTGERICKGQLIWKLNDSWPQIFCSLLDYDLEAGIPYYTIKRIYQPVHILFDMEDHITIWAVNDSRDDFSGTMEFVLFNPIENKAVYQFTKEVTAVHGESVIICDLDHITQFKRENLLYACLKNKEGIIAARNYELVEIERNFSFPDAVVTLEKEGEYLTVTTDRFARCIELNGICWDGAETVDFDDNYFDLLPFEKRSIKIHSSAKQFRIMAKPHYSSTGTIIEFKQEGKK